VAHRRDPCTLITEESCTPSNLLREHQRAGIGRRLFGSVARGLAEGGITALLAWVLARNPSRRFYEAVGGKLLGSQEIDIGGARLEEVAYGWPDIDSVASLC
jgi:hypothetical protein